ncbi:uncharacterized protein N7511_007167 [Penicillium nucicola]|uniref:uncharacterized protein n=1 Tax=Penicillium nucicola TaxID=1850975 RepID=UPI002544E630|nr:uncharacterized protein N7511_007167 [Penicillium nucicola]KAJ5756985.1 hypothetical protein N7511_007167 [Penicillium nucicola]
MTSEKEKNLASLRESIANLEAQQAQLESEIASTTSQLKYVLLIPLDTMAPAMNSEPCSIFPFTEINDPSATVKRHIRLLHDYNEIKDVGQGLMGLIAEERGVRQVEVEREFGVEEKD